MFEKIFNFEMRNRRRSNALTSLIVFFMGAGGLSAGVDFVRDIQPIFADKCIKCHGSEKQKSGLRLDSREITFSGGDSGDPAVVPNDSAKSLLIELISADDKKLRMPSKGSALTGDQISLLKKWVDAGAKWPDSANVIVSKEERNLELKITDSDREYWAFRPLVKTLAEKKEVNLVDKYFRGQLVFDQASRHKLIRRLSFDLLGLPPSPVEVEFFLNDKSVDAYEKLVDRMLNSKHYGERWGRHWLDVARYADSDGYEIDLDRKNAWPYRDWVIRALNDDLPFDLFVKWQISGDEIAPANPDAVIATGFLAAGPWQTTIPSNTEENKLKIRYDELDDMVSTTSSAFLGLTLGCARCHDHKFDPIPTRDYYRMVATFSTTERRAASLSKPQREFDKWRELKLREWLEWKMDKIKLSRAEKFWMRQPRSPQVKVSVDFYKKYGKQLTIENKGLKNWLPSDQLEIWNGFEKAVLGAQFKRVADQKSLMILDRQAEPAAEYLLERGGVQSRKENVSFGFLQVMTGARKPSDYRQAYLAAKDHNIVREQGYVNPPTTYQRAALADWMTDVRQGAGSLLARVMINRVWQHYFGEGFVSTPNDIGFQSEDPRDPKLLEALASRFAYDGWKLKQIQRVILLSEVYRSKAGVYRSPRRLESEAIRDAMLEISGRLNRKMFGPPYRPIIPPEAIATRSSDPYPTDIKDGVDIWRRSIYAFNKRSVPNPLMEVFDFPDSGASCGRRNATTIPTQALTLLNSNLARECAAQFSLRVISDVGLDSGAQIQRAYQLALGRPASEKEEARAREFLKLSVDSDGDSIPVEGLTDLCHTLFTLNEFAYID